MASWSIWFQGLPDIINLSTFLFCWLHSWSFSSIIMILMFRNVGIFVISTDPWERGGRWMYVLMLNSWTDTLLLDLGFCSELDCIWLFLFICVVWLSVPLWQEDAVSSEIILISVSFPPTSWLCLPLPSWAPRALNLFWGRATRIIPQFDSKWRFKLN